MGLNCLNFHRNIGKPPSSMFKIAKDCCAMKNPARKIRDGCALRARIVRPNGEYLTKGEGNDDFASQNKLRPPDSVDTSGKGPDGDGVVFWEKYEEEKIMEMVKRDRSHPSLIMYSLQNESSEIDLHNPRIYRIFRRMHELDPSRIITMFSGGVPKDQVLMLPYSDEIRYGSKAINFAGWKDVHTCGGRAIIWIIFTPTRSISNNASRTRITRKSVSGVKHLAQPRPTITINGSLFRCPAPYWL